jgi:single-strand DNA-binding protein
MLNKVLLIGNVGSDPEVRYLEGNNGNGGNAKVATIRLATSERFRDRSGEQRENTEWHNVVAWRNLADLAENFIRKGTQIYVEGRLRTREFTDQTGAKRFRTEIVADNIQLLGKRGDNPGAQDGPAQQGGGYGQGSFQGRQGNYPGQQGGYNRPAQQPTGYPGPQGYAGPQQGAYAAQPAAPAPAPQQAFTQPAPATVEPIDISTDNPDDDLPF